jgi:hypothetical protein
MMTLLRRFAKSVLPNELVYYLRERRKSVEIKKWERDGRPMPPPPMVKHKVVAEYQEKFVADVLVETGTFYGEMVEAQRRRFRKVISIELAHELFVSATNRFAQCRNVQIIHGDSGKELPRIVEGLRSRAIFWLDGHYSGGLTAKGEKDCPIFEELSAIFKQSNGMDHIVLVDDARCFDGQGDYPTIEELTKFIRTLNPNYQIEVKDDIIRFTIG